MIWNRGYQQSISSGPGSTNYQATGDINIFANFPAEFVDEKISVAVDIIRESRFFAEFDSMASSKLLGQRLVEGNFSHGSNEVKGRALTWLARFLAYQDLETAKNYLVKAKELSDFQESNIAEAFILSQEADQQAALSCLAGIDSPASRSAAFMVKIHHEGQEEAVNWLNNAEINTIDLDSDGKFHLLACELGLENWDGAMSHLHAISAHDFEETPVLHHMVAITKLLSAVPTEFRAIIQGQLPLDMARFPLADIPTFMEMRREAQQHFMDAANAAKELSCPKAALIDEQYALWLELRDPNNHTSGKQKLEEKFRDLQSGIFFVPLGVQFGIELNTSLVEDEINKQVALYGGTTTELSLVRLALAMTQATHGAVANYIAQHFDDLSEHLNVKLLRFMQIEMLSYSGKTEEAGECLEALKDIGLSEGEERRLRRLIAETEGINPVEARKRQFGQDNSLDTLLALVAALEEIQDWLSLCEYAVLLFERTHSLEAANSYATALHNTAQFEELSNFLEANSDLLSQSPILQLNYVWALYHQGELVKARTELGKLPNFSENSNCRLLQRNIAIALGDWNSLATIVENDYEHRDTRNASELLEASYLALNLGISRSKDLLFAAAEKGLDDADVMASAYSLAVNAAWESEEGVTEWLHKAVALSKQGDGPIQTVSLQELVQMKPEWERGETEILQLLNEGKIPLFMAAQYLNKSLIQVSLFPALVNTTQVDPRRRVGIPAFSGQRIPSELHVANATIGLDATVLLTLSFLDVLEVVLDSLDAVYIPHKTLNWLFVEKQKAVFHQPSRIEDASQIRGLIAQGALEKFTPSYEQASTSLAGQVGIELATLIAEATTGSNEQAQCLVVGPSPVYRLGSLMDEEADLSDYHNLMCSCLAIVEKLREKGQLTAAEERKARDYLRLQEKPWPEQPQIRDGATLFLSNLAVNYLSKAGILDKLNRAGLRAVVSPEVISEADALIAYESISKQVNDTIERIRLALYTRIESGKIKVGKSANMRGLEDRLSNHPTVNLLTLAPACDAIVSDDRMLNQHENVDEGGERTPAFTTLDLIDVLAAKGAISAENRLEYRTRLRQAGHFFIPLDEDELITHLSASKVSDGKVIETAELKAIRENILLIRMRDYLQIPQELTWLNMTREILIRALKRLWKESEDFSEARDRSNWLLELSDLRGWLHRVSSDSREQIARNAHITMVLSLYIAPSDQPTRVVETYWQWFEDVLLLPTKEQFPDIYEWIISYQKDQIARLSEKLELFSPEAT